MSITNMPADELTWSPAWKIRDLVADKKVSAVEVTEHFLARIETLDPKLNAFRVIDRDGALEQARQIDAGPRAETRDKPLLGVPVSVKEHIAVKGVRGFGWEPGAAVPAVRDDILVERLRRAGAVIIGTNTMPGMGNSPLYGGGAGGDFTRHPRNPWDLARVPGSSSAGGAAAVAAALTPVAIGTDGGGSTRLPAALSGVIGVHTARGRIPYVNYEHPNQMLTISMGPLTRDVRDAAIMMQAMAGGDGRDFIAIQDPSPDYVGALRKGVKGLKLAWTDDYGFGSMYAVPQSSRVIEAVRAAASGFRQLGASVDATKEVWEDFWPSYVVTSQAQGEGPMSATPTKPSPAAVQAAHELRARNWDVFMRVFATHDLLISPTIQFTAPTVEEWHASWNVDGASYPHHTFAPTYTSETHMFNWLGWPAVSIPCGFVDQMPVGLQVVAPPNREALIYQAIDAFLEAFPRRERPPTA